VQAEQRIADAAAHEKGLEAGIVQPVQDLQRIL
jgi:hypothetical protein